MSQPTVCLSFDWDGVSVWMAGGATDARSLSRGNSDRGSGFRGCSSCASGSGSPRRSSRPATRRRPSRRRQGAIAAAGHEIAAHGYVHEDFEQLSLEEARGVIRRAADAIERVVGARPRGMRFPPWAVEGEHFVMLLEEGYTYSSSVMDDVRPHWARAAGVVRHDGPNEAGPEIALVEVPDHVHHERLRVLRVQRLRTGRRCPRGCGTRATSSRSGSTSSRTTTTATRARSRCSCSIRRRSAGAGGSRCWSECSWRCWSAARGSSPRSSWPTEFRAANAAAGISSSRASGCRRVRGRARG